MALRRRRKVASLQSVEAQYEYTMLTLTSRYGRL